MLQVMILPFQDNSVNTKIMKSDDLDHLWFFF